MIWNQEFETLPREALESLQLKRLQATVNRVYATVPFYKKKFDETGLKPSHIKSLKDMRLLPFTVKTDLRDNYPFGLFSVPMSNIVRVHASSGTTGKPIVVGYTRRDIDTWAELMARTLTAAASTRETSCTMPTATAFSPAASARIMEPSSIGASVIPISGGNTKRQILILKDFGPTVHHLHPVLCPAPGRGGPRRWASTSSRDFKLQGRLFRRGSPGRRTCARRSKRRFSIDAIDIYGLTEVIGPGVSSECLEAKDGLHVFEDHFHPGDYRSRDG